MAKTTINPVGDEEAKIKAEGILGDISHQIQMLF
jgi:hypothetical protein